MYIGFVNAECRWSSRYVRKQSSDIYDIDGDEGLICCCEVAQASAQLRGVLSGDIVGRDIVCGRESVEQRVRCKKYSLGAGAVQDIDVSGNKTGDLATCYARVEEYVVCANPVDEDIARFEIRGSEKIRELIVSRRNRDLRAGPGKAGHERVVSGSAACCEVQQV